MRRLALPTCYTVRRNTASIMKELIFDVFEMIITMLFYLDLSGKNFRRKFLRSKSFNQKVRHQVMEAEAQHVEAKVIQKLLLPHPWPSGHSTS